MLPILNGLLFTVCITRLLAASESSSSRVVSESFQLLLNSETDAPSSESGIVEHDESLVDEPHCAGLDSEDDLRTS